MATARLSDIAASLGLNIATVSRALRDDPRIKEETRIRIKEEATRLGYRPHWGARALAEGRSRTFWFLVPSLESPIERDPAAWAGRWLLDRGYDLLVAQHYGDPSVYGRLLDRLAHGGADGAIIVPGSQITDWGGADRSLAEKGVPFVYLDRRVAGIPVPVVTTDNRGAAYALTERLVGAALDAGQPLNWIHDGFHPPLNGVEAERSEGLRAAAAAHGLAVYREGAGVFEQPGAFLASTVGSLGSPGLICPSDCRAAVFDDALGCALPVVQLLVAKQDFRALGEGAAALLLKILEGAPPTTDLRQPLLEVLDRR